MGVAKAIRRRPHELELKHLDIELGDHLLFPNERGEDGDEFWEFKGLTADGTLSLVSDRTGRKKILSELTFNQMRGSGEAIRFTSDGAGAKAASEYEIPPGLTADPLVQLPRAIEESLEAKRRFVKRRRIVRQFAILFDEAAEWVSKGELGLARFIRANSHRVNHHGLEWDPSASNLREAINKCGVPGNRPLTAFLVSTTTTAGGGRWHHLVQQLRSEMIAWYWSSPKVRICDAIDRFKVSGAPAAPSLRTGDEAR